MSRQGHYIGLFSLRIAVRKDYILSYLVEIFRSFLKRLYNVEYFDSFGFVFGEENVLALIAFVDKIFEGFAGVSSEVAENRKFNAVIDEFLKNVAGDNGDVVDDFSIHDYYKIFLSSSQLGISINLISGQLLTSSSVTS